ASRWPAAPSVGANGPTECPSRKRQRRRRPSPSLTLLPTTERSEPEASATEAAQPVADASGSEQRSQEGNIMGMPAARVGDMQVCPMVTGVVPHVGGPIMPPGGIPVLIGGMPAARVGDMCVCVGPPDVIALGSFTVLIKGQPAARLGDMTAHGGSIIVG